MARSTLPFLSLSQDSEGLEYLCIAVHLIIELFHKDPDSKVLDRAVKARPIY